MPSTKILILADDCTTAHNLETRLQNLGYVVTALAASGTDALALIEQTQPEVVLIDLALRGEWDGIQSAAVIAARFATPIIFLTSNESQTVLDRAAELQPLGYVRQPASDPEIQFVIEAGLERRRLEAQNKEMQDRYRRLLETAHEGIWIFDASGATAYVNAKLAELLGYWVDELMRLPHEFLFDGAPDESLNLFGKRPPATVAEQYEFKFRRKDGSPLWAIVSTTPLVDAAGNYTGTLAMVSDITERKLMEEQLRRAREELEARVQARITDLAQANETLQALIVERKLAEKELEQAAEKMKTWVAELEQRNCEITWLNEMGNLLQGCGTLNEAYAIIAKFAQKFFPQMSGGIHLIHASRNYAERVTAWGPFPPEDQIFAPTDCWALRRGRVYAVSGEIDLQCNHLHLGAGGSYVCVPLTAQGEALGILHLRYNAEPAHALPGISEATVRLAIAMSEHISLALANLSLRETLRNQAIHDPLTGLFNRRYMEETLERELLRAARRLVPLSVIMFDLDHFKAFNDTFGHTVGDRVLQAVGIFLRQHARAEDITCRYGGEEFVVILPETTIDVALKRAEELRAGLKELTLVSRDVGQPGISVSLGVASYPAHGSTVSDLMQAADVALYSAKRAGRDRAMLAGPAADVTQRLNRVEID